jgi:DNA-binding transcriptional MerR regulator
MRDEIFDKSYLTIKEFSKLVGITPASLRHYDKTDIFEPAKRGQEFHNNYRYYSPMQLKSINVIRVLTEIGVSIEEIKELAHNRSPDKLLKLFHKNRDRLSDELRYLQEAHSIIETYTELLHEAIDVNELEISVSEVAERYIILGGKNDYSGSDNFVKEFARFCSDIHEPKLNPSYPIGGYFDSMTEFLAEPSLPTRFFSLDPKGNEEKKAGLYLIGYTRGHYWQANDLPKRMAEYAEKNGLSFSGPVYGIYLTDEVSETNSEDYLLQVSASVVETLNTPSHSPHHHFEQRKP